MNFLGCYEGCRCKKNGCYDHRCPCFLYNVGCTSKCKCPDTVCVNPIGVTGDESNAQPGGQRGTTGTPDKAELEPGSQIVQPRDTSPSALLFDFLDYAMRCWCKTDGCNDWHCPCFVSNVGCSSKCLCPAPVCVNPIGVRGGEHTTFCAVSDVYKAVESNAEPGGQRGTSGTPDEAELVPQLQIVQSRDTSPSAVHMDFVNYSEGCWCKTGGCNDWRCPCSAHNVGCSSKCLCLAPMCFNPIGVTGGQYTTFSSVCDWSDVYKAVEPKAEPGGQRGTGGTSNIPDEAGPEPEPKRQAVQPRCCCVNTKCLDGYCVCFDGNWLCSEDCVCEGCQNIESNEKEVLMLYKELVKRKLDIYYKFPLEPIPKRKLGAGALANGNLCRCTVYGCLTCSCVKRETACTLNCKCKDCRNPFGSREAGVSNAGPGQTTPPSSTETKTKRCHCKVNRCKNKSCYCVKHEVGCTSYCKCQGCDNPKGAKGSESNTGSGGANGIGNMPDEAVQTTTPSITEPGQVDNSSMAFYLDQPLRPISEWPGFESNTGSGGADGADNIPDEALQTTTPSITEPEQVDTSSTEYCLNQPAWSMSELRGFESNTGSGGADGVGNIPDEAVQTTTPSMTEPGKVDTSSTEYCLDQPARSMDEWPEFECPGFESNTGSGGADGAGNIPDEALQTTTPSITEPEQVDTSSTEYCLNQPAWSMGEWRGFESSTGSGGADGVGNIPDEAVQTTTPSITEPGKVDTSSMEYCLDQPARSMDECPGFESNTGSGGADGIGNIPDEAVQTTTPSITEPEQVDTSSMEYCLDQPARSMDKWLGFE